MSMKLSKTAVGGTSVAWPLRAWLAVEVLFGVAAIRAVFLSPADTRENFAWPIGSVVMAAVLGGFYLATAVPIVCGVFARRWEQVRVVVVTSIVFTSLMLLTTILHWDTFSVGSLPFAVWLASYVLPPPIFAVLWWWHQRRATTAGSDEARPLPPWFRSLCRVNGAAYVVVSTLLFIVPSGLIGRGPWPLTPLTVRTLCGFLIATGVIMLGIAWENDWRRVRLASLMLLVLGPAQLIQLLRFRDQVQWSNLWLLIDGIDFLLFAAIVLWLWIRDARQGGAGRATADRDSTARTARWPAA
jgi:hypothetical protein